MRNIPKFWHKLRLASAGLAALALVAGCASEGASGTAGPAPEPSREPLVKTVRAEPITVRDFGDPLVTEGTVRPAEVFWVTAKYAGEVLEVVKGPGDPVAEGDIIIRLTSEELRKELSSATAAHQAALRRLSDARQNAAELAAMHQRNVAAATADWNRARNDYDLGLIGEAELERAREQLERVRLEAEWTQKQQNALISGYQQEVNMAAQYVKEWTSALEELHIRSTVSGVISQVPLTPGMRVGLGTQAALVEKTDRVRISVPIPEELIRYVRGKTAFTIESSGQKQTAQVVSLGDVPEGSKYPLVLEADNTALGLKSGMKVNVYVTDESQRHALAVPANAILHENGMPHIFVIRGDRVEKRQIVTGRLHEGYQEILSGAQENEWLAVTGISSLKDQEQVQVQEQRVDQS